LDIRIAEKWTVFCHAAQKTLQSYSKYGLQLKKSANSEGRMRNFGQKHIQKLVPPHRSGGIRHTR
jgi:hypothetical protein